MLSGIFMLQLHICLAQHDQKCFFKEQKDLDRKDVSCDCCVSSKFGQAIAPFNCDSPNSPIMVHRSRL